MTTPNASPSAKGRRKFTPQVIEKIKEFVAQGISRDEIANRLGVTVGSLQVTCSRLGISLRRTNGSLRPTNSSRHMADARGRIPAPGSVGIAHTREQKEVSQPSKPPPRARPKKVGRIFGPRRWISAVPDCRWALQPNARERWQCGRERAPKPYKRDSSGVAPASPQVAYRALLERCIGRPQVGCGPFRRPTPPSARP